MAVEYLDKGNDDGTIFGQTSSAKIGFYGITTPIVQDAFDNAAVATTVAVSTTTAQWFFSTSSQANAIVALVNELREKLVSLNLVVTA